LIRTGTESLLQEVQYFPDLLSGEDGSEEEENKAIIEEGDDDRLTLNRN
jgi:hypothetical protein